MLILLGFKMHSSLLSIVYNLLLLVSRDSLCSTFFLSRTFLREWKDTSGTGNIRLYAADCKKSLIL
jgi:hypothetical protein